MPFEDDRESFLRAVDASPWPTPVKKHLRTPLGSFSSGKRLYMTAWASLLSHIFPFPEYVVCPESSYRQTGACTAGEAAKSRVRTNGFRVISSNNFAVVWVELNDSMKFEKLSARLEADDQVRLRAWDTHTSWFYNFDRDQGWSSILKGFRKIFLISAFGYKAKVYELGTETFEILPHATVASKPRTVEDLAPMDDWNVDVLTELGVNIMRAIAEHTHQGALAAGFLTSHPGNRFDDYNAYLPNLSPTTGASVSPEQAMATSTTDSPISVTHPSGSVILLTSPAQL